MAWDTRGRLWITNTIEYPYPAKPGTEPRDSIKILEDTDGDGLADKVTTFADKLNIPMGLLPTAGIVAHRRGKGNGTAVVAGVSADG